MKGKKCGCMGSKIGFTLVWIGALNWGLVGLGWFFSGNWNVVHLVLGGIPWLENLVYLLVGLAAIGMCVGCKCKKCKTCKEGGENMNDAPSAPQENQQ